MHLVVVGEFCSLGENVFLPCVNFLTFLSFSLQTFVHSCVSNQFYKSCKCVAIIGCDVSAVADV